VIPAAHHRPSDLRTIRPLDGGEFNRLLASYDNVLAYLVGHIHSNAVRHINPHDDTPGYWELTCASTVDFPHHTRILELVWEQNGYLSLYVTNLSQNSPPGTPGHKARLLAAGRKAFTSEDPRSSWVSQQESSNLLIRHPVPDDVTANLAAHSWPARIESVDTLQSFDAPPTSDDTW
jgi:hypothetical protein